MILARRQPARDFRPSFLLEILEMLAVLGRVSPRAIRGIAEV
jgi:hypothetical protein